MFGLSRKTEYAVTALARLAEADSAAHTAISARALADRDELPPALLSAVLKTLHRHGLVASKRGARGGYRLAVAPERLAMADVIAAIEGPELVRLTPCCEQDEPGHHEEGDGCRLMCRCPITGAIRRLNQRMQAQLRQLTLADLMRPAGEAQTAASTVWTSNEPRSVATSSRPAPENR